MENTSEEKKDKHIISIDYEKLTAVISSGFHFEDEKDPIRQIIEKSCGKIIKVIPNVTGEYVIICEGR